MAEERAQRRLAAILAADVVGYSRLMERDEAGTLTALKSRRTEILQPTVSKHRGRIVKLMGDGVLVEFASAVNAVSCAVEIQEGMEAANTGVPEDCRVRLRVGINLGDVIVEGGDLYGDGVNIAARLESVADPGDVFVSETVFTHVQGKVAIGFEDLGEHQLKNVTNPVRVYRLKPDSAVMKSRSHLALPGKPSIAVLPLTNLSGDPDQQYLSDGITEDIITELSRYHDLLVMARNSSFQFRDKSLDIKRVGRDLGVEYVVEGSLRKAGDRIRVTAQLIEVATGSHVWAEKYDRHLQDVFAIQDQVSQTIAATLVGRVSADRAEGARRKPTSLWAAYDCVLQAMECINRNDTKRAQTLLDRAVEIDPQYAQAYALASICKVFEFYADYKDETLNEALDCASKALGLYANDGFAHAQLGMVHTHLSHWDLARVHLEKAMSFNPNSVFFASLFAQWLLRVGRTEEALHTLDAALERDPLQPPWYWELRSMCFLRLRRYEDLIDALNRKNPLQSWDHATLAIAYAYLGQKSEARTEMALALNLQPNMCISGWVKTDPYKNREDQRNLVEDLKKAGVPE